MSESVNGKVTAIEEIFKRVVWDNTVEGLLLVLFAEAPWLNLWPVRQIITGLANTYSTKLWSGLVLLGDIQIIKFKNEAHQAEFEKASTLLMVVAYNHGIESQEFKDAREKAKVALSRFTRFST